MTAAAGKTAAAAGKSTAAGAEATGKAAATAAGTSSAGILWNSVTRNIFPEESGVMPYLPVIQRLDRSDILNGRLALGMRKNRNQKNNRNKNRAYGK
jgi:hypothetical protein